MCVVRETENPVNIYDQAKSRLINAKFCERVRLLYIARGNPNVGCTSGGYYFDRVSIKRRPQNCVVFK